ncbi:hypothetical protein [Acinetobacter larvae]|uniref:Uncharacterized protein n=1 Tax=Acinetobacter larvae TaxID=1789224 RepID=A0A1B2M0A4_9GAMM|nr:hypothetical protein [Acinetobacter larvae]AOA58627.1 hypothetical protein BFG52_09870 [Acinetobacter larvae]
MHILKNWFNDFKFPISLDYLSKALIIFMVLVIVVTSIARLRAPISLKKYNNVVMLSQQKTQPYSQYYAQQLLPQQINHVMYFKLMWIHQKERAQIQHYAAVDAKDNW